MNTRFKVFASYNILQDLYDFIHVLIFVTVSNAEKNPKLTNIVISGCALFMLQDKHAVAIGAPRLTVKLVA